MVFFSVQLSLLTASDVTTILSGITLFLPVNITVFP
jgi:hypothetical protein